MRGFVNVISNTLTFYNSAAAVKTAEDGLDPNVSDLLDRNFGLDFLVMVVTKAVGSVKTLMLKFEICKDSMPQ